MQAYIPEVDDDGLDPIRQRVAKGQAVREAVIDALEAGFYPPEETAYRALVMGLTQMLHHDLANVRSDAARGVNSARSGRFQVRGVTPKESKSRLATIRLRNAQGRMVGILDFTTEDCEQFGSWAKSQRLGWAKREEWMKAAAAAMAAADVASVRGLPLDAIRKLEELATEVW